MATLKDTLWESIFNDDDIIQDVNKSLEDEVKRFIYDTYMDERGNKFDENKYRMVYDKSLGKYIIHSKKVVQVRATARMNISKLTNDLFVWGTVKEFNCQGCTKLISLEGAPQKVNYTFDCSGCTSLKSLEGCPQEARDIYCINCDKLETVEGAPQKVHAFICSFCSSLKSLKGAPQTAELINCTNCKNLSKIDWTPIKVTQLARLNTKVSGDDWFELNEKYRVKIV